MERRERTSQVQIKIRTLSRMSTVLVEAGLDPGHDHTDEEFAPEFDTVQYAKFDIVTSKNRLMVLECN
jgi:hypothetical protein